MKITIDTKTNKFLFGQNNKMFNQLSYDKQQEVEKYMRSFLDENTNMTMYDEDSIWMSYRYCIGRHTIAAHTRAKEIWDYCKNKVSKNTNKFKSFAQDINKEIENSLRFINPIFHFPFTSNNEIYAPAIDVFCEFLIEFDIQSKEDLLKYRDVNVIPTDNERGYKFETVTWDDYLKNKVYQILKKAFDTDITMDFAWNYFNEWRQNNSVHADFFTEFNNLTIQLPKIEYYSLNDVEDLFIWNDLVHAFNDKFHHKSILNDGSEVEWFWSWTDNLEKHDDGYYYKSFGYRRVRVPIDNWHRESNYIPDKSIKTDIY